MMGEPFDAFAHRLFAFFTEVSAFKLEMEHESGSDSGINAPYTIWAGDSRLISADCTNYATVWTPTLQSMSNAPMDPYPVALLYIPWHDMVAIGSSKNMSAELYKFEEHEPFSWSLWKVLAAPEESVYETEMLYAVGDSVFARCENRCGLCRWVITDALSAPTFFAIEPETMGRLGGVVAAPWNPDYPIVYCYIYRPGGIKVQFWTISEHDEMVRLDLELDSAAPGPDDFELLRPNFVFELPGLNPISVSPDLQYCSLVAKGDHIIVWNTSQPNKPITLQLEPDIADFAHVEAVNFVQVQNRGVVVCGCDSGVRVIDGKDKSRENSDHARMSRPAELNKDWGKAYVWSLEINKLKMVCGEPDGSVGIWHSAWR